MGVYIKDMEMPKSCYHCSVLDDYGDYPRCRITEEQRGYNFPVLEKRMDSCPLVPVPPHYDLIDHNALKIAVMNGDCETRIDFLKHTMDCINKAPVVIPSDMQTYEDEEGE